MLKKIEEYKHMNKILIISGMLAFSSGAALVNLDYKRADLEVQKAQKNDDGQLLMTLMKGSNLVKVKDMILDISKVNVRGLWLTSISFSDEQNQLTIIARAIDHLDIYKYSSQMNAAVRSKSLCLQETDVVKKDKKNELNKKKNSESNAPVPFVLAFLAKQKADRDKNIKKEEGDDEIKQDPNEDLRWVYNYEATFKYGSCF